MNLLTVVVGLSLLVLFVVVLLGRAILQLWVGHRTRLTFISLAEKQPDLFSNVEQIETLLERPGLVPSPRQNYAVTGLFLAAIGVGGVVYAHLIRVGHLAAGALVGGIACIAIAFILVVIGYFLQRQ